MPTNAGIFVKLVAGARIERASSGYEPDEIPLLYPAISSHCTTSIEFCNTLKLYDFMYNHGSHSKMAK